MIIGVPKEIYPGERRVALVPAVLPTLTMAGFEVHIQAGAGVEAGYPDSVYSDKGAKIVADRAAVARGEPGASSAPRDDDARNLDPRPAGAMVLAASALAGLTVGLASWQLS